MLSLWLLGTPLLLFLGWLFDNLDETIHILKHGYRIGWYGMPYAEKKLKEELEEKMGLKDPEE